MVTPALSFSTLKGTDPGSPTIRVNVEFSPIVAALPPLTFNSAKSYLVPNAIFGLVIFTTEF